MPNSGDEQIIINAKSIMEMTGIEPAENMEEFLTEVQKELNEKFLSPGLPQKVEPLQPGEAKDLK